MHRGADPRDREQFGAEALGRLRTATAELSWLLGRGYAETSALKLVGDRHRLNERQRMAVRRSACGDEARASRERRRMRADELAGRHLDIDGFNVLTTVEAALGGAVVLAGRDGSYRDLAGVHGTYRKVAETLPALERVGRFLEGLRIAGATWYLDRPVSNSGRLSVILAAMAAERGWPWTVELEYSPDAVLARSPHVVATADAGILDRCGPWLPLARAVISETVEGAWVIDLEGAPRLDDLLEGEA